MVIYLNDKGLDDLWFSNASKVKLVSFGIIKSCLTLENDLKKNANICFRRLYRRKISGNRYNRERNEYRFIKVQLLYFKHSDVQCKELEKPKQWKQLLFIPLGGIKWGLKMQNNNHFQHHFSLGMYLDTVLFVWYQSHSGSAHCEAEVVLSTEQISSGE